MPLPPIHEWKKRLGELNAIPGSSRFLGVREQTVLTDCVTRWDCLSPPQWNDWEEAAISLLMAVKPDEIEVITHAVRGGIWHNSTPVLWIPAVLQLRKNYGGVASFRHSIGAISHLTDLYRQDALQIMGAAFCNLNRTLRPLIEFLGDSPDDNATPLIFFFNYFRNSLILALDFANDDLRAGMDETGRSPLDSGAHIYMDSEDIYRIFYDYLVAGRLPLQADDDEDFVLI